MTLFPARAREPHEPWQLRMFDLTLKKRQKVELLLRLVGPLDRRRCLLLTGGDNNGAMNYRFRQAGGAWQWAEMEEHTIPTMESLLCEEVRQALPHFRREVRPLRRLLDVVQQPQRSCQAHLRPLGPRWCGEC